jgi:PAS domain S-box-containing protein
MTNSTPTPRILDVFGRLLNESHDIFLVCDASWNVVYANKKACAYFNEDNALVGKNLLTEFPSVKESQLVKQFTGVAAAGKPSEFEAMSPISKRWMYYRAYPLEDLLAIYATDINLRKEAQRTIQQNQERYFNFISQSTEGIWRCEVEQPIPVSLSTAEQIDLMYRHGYMAECNDAMARMYGFRDAYDIMGSRLDALLPKLPQNVAYLAAFVEAGYKLYDAESIETAKDGSPVYMLNNLMGVIENDHLVRAWGTQRDITMIKEVEEKLKDAQLQLNLALAAGSAGTFIWNIKTNKVQWTKEEEALYGLPEGSFGGTFDNWAKAVHPDDLPEALKTLQRAIENKTDLDMEFRIILPDGTIRWIYAKGQVEYDDNMEAERMIGINIDVTARKNQ